MIQYYVGDNRLRFVREEYVKVVPYGLITWGWFRRPPSRTLEPISRDAVREAVAQHRAKSLVPVVTPAGGALSAAMFSSHPALALLTYVLAVVGGFLGVFVTGYEERAKVGAAKNADRFFFTGPGFDLREKKDGWELSQVLGQTLIDRRIAKHSGIVWNTAATTFGLAADGTSHLAGRPGWAAPLALGSAAAASIGMVWASRAGQDIAVKELTALKNETNGLRGLPPPRTPI